MSEPWPEPRLRRSMLMTPGNRLDRMRKAATLNADCVVFDLEDSVPPTAKGEARACVAQALAAIAAGGVERCVRINALASGFGASDLESLPLAQIDSIMLPKVESAAEVIEVERRLEALDLASTRRARPIELVLTLETPRGVLQALQITDAGRLATAVFFGSGDYSAATGGAVTDTALLFARSTVAAAAGASRLQAIDAAFFQDVRDAEATRRDAIGARELGFCGKVVFHPAQIVAVNEVFTPRAAQVEQARRVVSAYEHAMARGHSTALVDGVFVAIDLVVPARRLLSLAEAASARDRDRPEAS